MMRFAPPLFTPLRAGELLLGLACAHPPKVTMYPPKLVSGPRATLAAAARAVVRLGIISRMPRVRRPATRQKGLALPARVGLLEAPGAQPQRGNAPLPRATSPSKVSRAARPPG